MVGVGADGGLIGIVNLVPLAGITIVVLGNFGKRITRYYGVRITLSGSSRLVGVAEEIGIAGSRLIGWLNRFLLAFIQKIEESHGSGLLGVGEEWKYRIGLKAMGM